MRYMTGLDLIDRMIGDKEISRQLKKCPLTVLCGGFLVIIGISDKKPHDYQARNQITTR